jgi:hypothetical protein
LNFIRSGVSVTFDSGRDVIRFQKNGTGKLVRGTLVARRCVLVISATSKALAAAVLVTGAVASQQDLPIYLTGLSAVQASIAEGERVVVNSQYKPRQNAKGTETLPTPAVADQARAL